MLKIDLHLHVKGDPQDKNSVRYTAVELIDYMAKKEFDVIAITPHLYNNLDDNLKEYARQRNVLLILGTELRLEGCDILVYNIDSNKLKKVKKIKDLLKLKGEDNLIVAPHPFFFPHSLRNKLVKNINVFDAIEYSHFYTRGFNLNKKTVVVSKKYNKPLIGNSDAHNLCQIRCNYTYVDSKKNINSIFTAIKEGNVQLKTRALTKKIFIKIVLLNLIGPFRKRLK